MSIISNYLTYLVLKLCTKPLSEANIELKDTELMTRLVLSLGSLEVYSAQSAAEYAMGIEPKMFYYTDTRYLAELKGPFHSVYNATEHYTKHLEAFKKAVKSSTGKDYVEQNPKSNLVMVNFVTKQRHRIGST